MSEPVTSVNGSSPASGSGLHEAIQRHAQALANANTRPDGTMQVNLLQMFGDLALAEVRIEILFEAIRDGVSEPHALTKMLTERLHQNARELEDLIKPQIAIPSRRVPRNG